jgi:hypothetical protein
LRIQTHGLLVLTGFFLRFDVANYSISKENVVLIRYSIEEFDIFGI